MSSEIPRYVDNIPVSDKFRRFIWRVISLFFFKPFSLPVFNFWRIFLLKIFGAHIGKGSIVYSNAYIPSPWNLFLGKESCIGPEVKFHIGKTMIGDKVTVSQRTYLCSATHKIDSINTPFVSGIIVIKDFAWIASEAFIMSNVTIGEGAVVGARSVVIKDVEDWSVVAGNPARFIKKREVYDYDKR